MRLWHPIDPSEDFVEHREDLSELLLDGLPAEEREHVINVIRQGDAEKLRRKRAEKPIPAQDGDHETDYSDAALDADLGAGEEPEPASS
ncbi:MAG TPA: hypothetical protein VHX15_17785 [Frankiaceae bacterium]|nr:hypothetical protein [Frankiaceae bacterium]